MYGNCNDPRKNCEGYMDMTPYEADRNMARERREEERFNKLLRTIFYICDLAGFRICGRIVLEDVRTGRVWK